MSNSKGRRQESRSPTRSRSLMKRSFSREFKLQVVRQLVSGEKRFAQLCREHGLCQTLRRRRDQYQAHGENAWREPEPTRHVGEDPQARIAALEAALGRATLENQFLRHALDTVQKGGLARTSNGR